MVIHVSDVMTESKWQWRVQKGLSQNFMQFFYPEKWCWYCCWNPKALLFSTGYLRTKLWMGVL